MVRHGGRASLAELAVSASVTPPTLRHYFGGREDVIAAGIVALGDGGKQYTDQLAQPSSPSLSMSLQEAAVGLVAAFRHFGVGEAFSASVVAGLSNATVGHAAVDAVIEPIVDCIERRLRVHQDDGAFDAAADADGVRVAALAFLSPIIVALLHQDGLDGKNCRHLDVDAFLAVHVARFARAWGTDQNAAAN